MLEILSLSLHNTGLTNILIHCNLATLVIRSQTILTIFAIQLTTTKDEIKFRCDMVL